MQRQASTTRAIDLPQTSQPKSLFSPSPIRKMKGATDLPLYNSKRDISGSNFRERLVHLIPFLVLLCLFILWWFSYPVNFEMKNGRVTAAYRVVTQNTPSASIFPPYPSISEMQMVSNYGIAK